tara:strand:+ start:154 stop:1218 length:1065 start_codon:yes stop_codon:yes gene_type:complete
LHTDDLPILIFIPIAIAYIIKHKMFVLDMTGKYIFLFLIFLILQNLYINQSILSSDIYRFVFYLILYIYMTNNEGQFHYSYMPFILFIYLAVFAIIGYIFEINLGNDDYQTWNIGFNPSDLDYLKGRMNGFQAGGPNSFADLITITAVYSLFKYKNSYALFIVPLALIAVIVTYSRFSLIVLILFTFIKFIKDRLYAQLIVSVLVLSIAVIQLGVYERFMNDDNNGISDRLLMLEASTDYFISSSIELKLIGNGSNQLIFESNNIYLYDEFEKNPYSYGPHNSFIFYLINYGIVGVALYILIFMTLFKRKLVFDFNLITLTVFFILSLSTDLLHNHSVSWLLYIVYFSHIKSEK